jgi:hypothetical protein
MPRPWGLAARIRADSSQPEGTEKGLRITFGDCQNLSNIVDWHELRRTGETSSAEALSHLGLRIHFLEPPSEGLIHHLLQARVALPAQALDLHGDIVIKG